MNKVCEEALTQGIRNEVSRVMNQKAKCAWLNRLAKDTSMCNGDKVNRSWNDDHSSFDHNLQHHSLKFSHGQH